MGGKWIGRWMRDESPAYDDMQMDSAHRWHGIHSLRGMIGCEAMLVARTITRLLTRITRDRRQRCFHEYVCKYQHHLRTVSRKALTLQVVAHICDALNLVPKYVYQSASLCVTLCKQTNLFATQPPFSLFLNHILVATSQYAGSN